MLHTASLTPMHYYVVGGRSFNAHWLHHAAARFCSVAGTHVNMLRPKAFRTMVRVAISLNDRVAVLTREIFDPLLKTHIARPQPAP